MKEIIGCKVLVEYDIDSFEATAGYVLLTAVKCQGVILKTHKGYNKNKVWIAFPDRGFYVEWLKAVHDARFQEYSGNVIILKERPLYAKNKRNKNKATE